MSAQDVAHQLDQASNLLPINSLEAATRLIGEAADLLHAVTETTNDATIVQATTSWREAAPQIAQALHTCTEVRSRVEIYKTEILGTGDSTPSRLPARKRALTREAEKSIATYHKRIREHQDKLERYRRDPYSVDNKGHLRNAPNDATRDRIYRRRIAGLEQEIQTFRNNIRKVYDGEL